MKNLFNPTILKGADQVSCTVGGTIVDQDDFLFDIKGNIFEPFEQGIQGFRLVENRNDYRESLKAIFILLHIDPIHS